MDAVTNFRNGVFRASSETGVEQQVFWRVAADAEFGEYDQVGLKLVPRAFSEFDDLCRIAPNGADRQVQLCERDFD